MKNNLFFTLIFFLIFFSKNISSSYKFENSLDCCLIATTATLTHNCGQMLHKKCIFDFDETDHFDTMCARTTGIITTTVIFNFAAGGSLSPVVLYTPIIAHNISKIAAKQLNEFTSPNSYEDSEKPTIKKMQ